VNEKSDSDVKDADFQTRRREYKAVQAPSWIATRVKSRAREAAPGKSWLDIWRPVTAGLAVALGILAVGPLLDGEKASAPNSPPLPSLTALSRNLPAKSPGTIPSFATLRSLPTPLLPSRPRPVETEPQSQRRWLSTEFLLANLKEKHDENA
jgi:hypothetical protein